MCCIARRAATLAALLCAALLAGCAGGDGAARYAGQVLDPARPAPDFAARNASGRLVRLSEFRGRAVLLTFLYSRCPDVCPLIVGNLDAALKRLGPSAARAQVVAVSVDPKGDTSRRVRKFVAEHGMTGRIEYLIGSERELAPIWRAYGVAVEASPEDREVGHSGSVRGITATGRQKTIYPADFSASTVAHDVPALAED